MDKKVVVCDIDNTLIVKHTTLTPRAKAVIQTLQKHGIYFGIASGRSLIEVKRMIHAWGFEDLDLLISLNGSILWDGIAKKEYQYYLMKKEWIKEVIAFMSQFDTNPMMYKGNHLLCGKLDEMVRLSTSSSKMEPVVVDSMADFYTEDNAKIMFRTSEEDTKKIEAYFKEHPNGKYRAFKTQSTLIEFSDDRVSKAYTLQKFCDLHNLSLDDVIAFGDTSNDNDMLMASGWGVCLRNGSEDTKAIADEITEKTCAEDGWADYMETHVIQPKGW